VTQAIQTGDLDRLRRLLEASFAGAAPAAVEVNRAFWGACHGGQRACAEYLLDRGADLDWVPPWEPLTPLDAAARGGADDLVAWLRGRGARPAAELPT
jgi:ankyrin repeat protein